MAWDEVPEPAGSFVAPVIPPATEPTDGEQLTVCLPVDWLPYILGALTQLALPATWETDDEDERQLTIARARRLIAMIDTPVCTAETEEIEAPYWDDTTADDAGAAAPKDDQPWYGKMEGEDWLEYISWWVVGAFIAVTFTPTAAIAFTTFVRKLRVQFKKQNWGGIVKILVDGDNYATVDTYSPTDAVQSIDVYSPGSDIRIVYTGEHNPDATPNEDGFYGMTVIRKRFFEGEVVPENIRYDDGTDQVQQTFDGGATWVDAPPLDPRHSPTFAIPPLTGSDIPCHSAANMARGISDFLHNISEVASAATAAESILTVIIGGIAIFFPEGAAIGVLAFLALDLATTIFGATFAAVDAAFTGGVYDTLTCIFNCDAEPDGTLTADDLARVVADIDDQIGGLVATVLTGMFFLMGEVGVSNMGATGSAPADCSGCICGWSGCVDFRTGMHSWNILNDGTINARGQQIAGTGVATTGVGDSSDEIYVYRTFTAVEIVKVVIHGHHFMSGSPTGVLSFLNGGTNLENVILTPPGVDGVGNDWVLTWVGSHTVDQIQLTTTEPGGGSIEWLKFYGTVDDAPAWVDICP